jgi:hypothetical protein
VPRGPGRAVAPKSSAAAAGRPPASIATTLVSVSVRPDFFYNGPVVACEKTAVSPPECEVDCGHHGLGLLNNVL